MADRRERQELVDASETYWKLAQTAAYEDLIGPYVELWLNANIARDDKASYVTWPDGSASGSSSEAVWATHFDRIPIDLWHKPALSVEKPRHWGHIKEMLLLLKAEIPYLAHLKKWMETVISLNSCRPASSNTVFLPRGGGKLYSVSKARRWWKEGLEDREGALKRRNIVLVLQKRVDDFDWYPMDCGGFLKAMSKMLQDRIFQEFFDLRSQISTKRLP